MLRINSDLDIHIQVEESTVGLMFIRSCWRDFFGETKEAVLKFFLPEISYTSISSYLRSVVHKLPGDSTTPKLVGQ